MIPDPTSGEAPTCRSGSTVATLTSSQPPNGLDEMLIAATVTANGGFRIVAAIVELQAGASRASRIQ